MRKVLIFTVLIALISAVAFGAASVTRGKTFTSNETVTNSKLHTLVDSATISDVDQSNVATNYGLSVKSTSQPSDNDALWVDTSNNCLKAYVNGAYEEVGSSPSSITTGDITATGDANITGDVTTAGVLFADNAIRGWAVLSGSGTVTLLDSHNVASVNDDGTGRYTVTWARDFANKDYACVVQAMGSDDTHAITNSETAGSIQIWVDDVDTAAAEDCQRASIIAIGDLA